MGLTYRINHNLNYYLNYIPSKIWQTIEKIDNSMINQTKDLISSKIFYSQLKKTITNEKVYSLYENLELEETRSFLRDINNYTFISLVSIGFTLYKTVITQELGLGKGIMYGSGLSAVSRVCYSFLAKSVRFDPKKWIDWIGGGVMITPNAGIIGPLILISRRGYEEHRELSDFILKFELNKFKFIKKKDSRSRVQETAQLHQ